MLIYILTLPTSEDRFITTCNRLIDVGFSSTNFRKHIGIPGDTNPLLISIASNIWNCNGDLTPTQKGCSFAHLDVLHKFLYTNDTHCMIVEDDLLLPSNFMSLFNEVFNDNINKNYDILFIGWEESHNKLPQGPLPKYIPYHPMCMHCYIVSKSGAQKIINAIKQHGLDRILDVWFTDKASLYDITSLCVNPDYFDFDIPATARMNRANGIAFQDSLFPSTIDK